MKKQFKVLSGFLAFLMMFSTTSAFASSEDLNLSSEYETENIDFNLEFKSFEDIPKELLDPNYYSEEEIIQIPEEYLNPYHTDVLHTTFNPYENDGIQAYGLPLAAGIYFVPGVGQVAITATGLVTVAGATITAGSWIYNKISVYFSKKDAEKASKTIPNSLKSSGMKVDLKKFKDKHGNTPVNKTSGTFTNGKWKIEKDSANHIGYNGNKKVWKIGNPKRKGSLDKHGNIIDK